MIEGVKIKLIDNPYLNEKGLIREDCKFKITIPEFKIENSKIPGRPEDKFETMLFLPVREGTQREGGLRKKRMLKIQL
ncbi:MAG: hypothetical protein RMJ39_09405 [Deltaproteobacteria bacterium]|nr:hypothetical protein [Deltaproteobacteria bacterium]